MTLEEKLKQAKKDFILLCVVMFGILLLCSILGNPEFYHSLF